MLIDIHQHLISGVDDGAADMDASLEMLRQAAAQGVGGIVCTSHDAPGINPLDKVRYLRGLDALRQAARDEDIPVRLYSGTELLMTPEAIGALQAGDVLTLGESCCVLIEFYPDVPWQLMYTAAQKAREAGYRMVLAHAERYGCLREPDRVDTLRRELKVLVQVNADTVLRSGSLIAGAWTRKMLRNGLVDAVASDAHGTTYRPCRLGQCHDMLIRKYGQERAARLCAETPASILHMTIQEMEQ